MHFNENIRKESKIAEKSRGYTYRITHISVDNCPRVLKLDIKVELRHSTLTLWADIITNLFEYSWILMKTLQINEILWKRSRGFNFQNNSYLN